MSTTHPDHNANYLRHLAESADGIRNGPAFLVKRKLDGLLEVVSSVQTATHDLVSTFSTPDKQPPVVRPAIERWTIKAAGKDEVQLFPRYDAVFRSEAAVDKFVLPYYARHRKLDALAALLARYNTGGVYALGHLPNSDYETKDFLGSLGLPLTEEFVPIE